MLSGQGFEAVYNLNGGIKGWNSDTALGGEDLGIAVFTGNEPPEQTLVVAYSLEIGLRDFYLSMIPKVKNGDVQDLFRLLSEIEIKHQDRIFKEYLKISGLSIDRDAFEKTTVSDAVEGGLTTEEYVNLFRPDWESPVDIVSLAMSIEAQALDLYTRAATRATNPQSKDMLIQIADEENAHLSQLGKLMDRIA